MFPLKKFCFLLKYRYIYFTKDPAIALENGYDIYRVKADLFRNEPFSPDKDTSLISANEELVFS
jgi:hypothetical protein